MGGAEPSKGEEANVRNPGGYIHEAWYPACWSDALERKPIGRTFLDEEVVLYRQVSGEPVALGNVCPHRFAALDKGRLHGDSIACPYHGLRFSPDGQCSHNPHGPAPKSVKIRAYPVAERYGMVWIWMGNVDAADPSKLPIIRSREDDRFDWVTGYLHVEGHYQLVTDNLLDLTHVQFMHPFIANQDERGNTVVKCFEDGDQVVSQYWQQDSRRSPLVAALWDGAPERISMAVDMRWTAPANLLQDNRFDEARPEPADGQLLIPFCHLLTPESPTTTHYFWAGGRNMKKGDPAVSAGFEQSISSTFRGEDEPMIADIQRRIGAQDLLELKPLLLSIDKSAVLARRRVSAAITQKC